MSETTVSLSRPASVARQQAGARRLRKTLLYVALSIPALIILFPFYWMMVGSTLSLVQLNQYPPILWFHSWDQWLANVREVVERGILTGMLNSIVIAVASILGQLVVCSMAAYGFAKHRFPGRDNVFRATLLSLMIPGTVSIIPWYLMMIQWFHWKNNFLALIVPALPSVFAVFWIRQYIIQAVPDELLDAARIDGCPELQILFQLVYPIITPVLATLALVIFFNAWNDFMAPLLIITEETKYTLQLFVAGRFQSGAAGEYTHLRVTALALSCAPVLAVFFLASRRVISGLTAGAIKQ